MPDVRARFVSSLGEELAEKIFFGNAVSFVDRVLWGYGAGPGPPALLGRPLEQPTLSFLDTPSGARRRRRLAVTARVTDHAARG